MYQYQQFLALSSGIKISVLFWFVWHHVSQRICMTYLIFRKKKKSTGNHGVFSYVSHFWDGNYANVVLQFKARLPQNGSNTITDTRKFPISDTGLPAAYPAPLLHTHAHTHMHTHIHKCTQYLITDSWNQKRHHQECSKPEINDAFLCVSVTWDVMWHFKTSFLYSSYSKFLTKNIYFFLHGIITIQYSL